MQRGILELLRSSFISLFRTDTLACLSKHESSHVGHPFLCLLVVNFGSYAENVLAYLYTYYIIYRRSMNVKLKIPQKHSFGLLILAIDHLGHMVRKYIFFVYHETNDSSNLGSESCN